MEHPNGNSSPQPLHQHDISEDAAEANIVDRTHSTNHEVENPNEIISEVAVADGSEADIGETFGNSVETPIQESISTDTGLSSTSTNPRNGPDITIIFEESYKTWSDPKVQRRLNELLRYERAACCFIVHSVPQDACKDLVQELREKGGCIFVTELSDNYYESFGDSWRETIDIIAGISENTDCSTDTEDDVNA